MAAAQVESHYAIHTGKLYKVSEQQLVDCSTYDYGCQGGWPTTAYRHWKISGVVEESLYPYINRDGTCYEEGLEKVMNVAGYVDVTYSNLDAFKAALRNGPTGVTFAVGTSFYYYKSGLYTASDCAS